MLALCYIRVCHVVRLTAPLLFRGLQNNRNSRILRHAFSRDLRCQDSKKFSAFSSPRLDDYFCASLNLTLKTDWGVGNPAMFFFFFFFGGGGGGVCVCVCVCFVVVVFFFLYQYMLRLSRHFFSLNI